MDPMQQPKVGNLSRNPLQGTSNQNTTLVLMMWLIKYYDRIVDIITLTLVGLPPGKNNLIASLIVYVYIYDYIYTLYIILIL